MMPTKAPYQNKQDRHAMCAGLGAAHRGEPNQNPFYPGPEHDAYEHGYATGTEFPLLSHPDVSAEDMTHA